MSFGVFVKAVEETVEIDREQVEANPPTTTWLRGMFFNHARADRAIRFTVHVLTKSSQVPISIFSDELIDKWANGLSSKRKLERIQSFRVHWEYELRVYDGLPKPAKPPWPEIRGENGEDGEDDVLTTVMYRSTDTLSDLHTRAFRAVSHMVDPRKVWFGMFDGARPTSVIPLLNVRSMIETPDLIMVRTVDYSLVDMSTVRSLVNYDGRFGVIAEDSFTSADVNMLLAQHVMDFITNLSANETERLTDLVDLAIAHLNVLCKIFDMCTCYNEATGRQIIDVFQSYASAFVGSPCKADAAAQLAHCENDAYIGSGTFDYFVEYLVPVITRMVHDPVEEEEEYLTAETKERRHAHLLAVTEAKNEVIMKTFAELLGQLLDQHRSSALKKQKVATAAAKSVFAAARHAHAQASTAEAAAAPSTSLGLCTASTRGILTTGQKTVFFSLDETAGLPKIVYYGTYTLNILPRLSHSKSGLEYTVNERGVMVPLVEGVDRAAVRQLLVAYIVFFQVPF